MSAENRSGSRVSGRVEALGGLWSRTLGRWLALLLIAPIRVYQRFISPLTPPSCRLYPSCSAYAVGSLQVHGPGKGLVLAAWRLLRCNPWNAGGVDPVPVRGRWLPDVLPDGRPRHGTMASHGHAPHDPQGSERRAI